MVELAFVAATALAIVVLLRRVPLRAPTLRTWTTLLGAILIAVPGVISLVSLGAPLFGANPFSDRDTVLVPAASPGSAASRSLAEAPAVLVRALLFVDAGETDPAGRHEIVVSSGEAASFTLADGSSLAFRIRADVRPGSEGQAQATLSYRWRSPRRSYGATVWIEDAPGGDRLDPVGAHRVRTEELALDFAWFGSLLDDAHRSARVHFFLTPLPDAAAVTAVAAPAWWQHHGADVMARIHAAEAVPQKISEGWGSSFDMGRVMSVSGLFVLLAGALLILMQSSHWVRALCLIFLYVTLYLGAMDSLLLRIHTTALAVGTPASRASAASEAASTRLHTVSAARALLDAAMSGDGKPTRLAAVRCLERERIRSVLPRVEDANRKLESLVTGPYAEIAAVATRIQEALATPNP